MEILNDNFKFDIQIDIYNIFTPVHAVKKSISKPQFIETLDSFTEARVAYLFTVITIAKELANGKDWRKFLHEFDRNVLLYLDFFIYDGIADALYQKVYNSSTLEL